MSKTFYLNKTPGKVINLSMRQAKRFAFDKFTVSQSQLLLYK